MQCRFSWNLLTWHQKLTTCGGMKVWWDTWKMTHRFTSFVTYNLFMKYPIWSSMFLNKVLVLANYGNMDVLFSARLKNAHTHLFFKLFYFLTSSKVRGSIGFLWPSSFEALSKSTWDYGLLTTSLVSLVEVFTCFITFPLWCPHLFNASYKGHSRWSLLEMLFAILSSLYYL